MVIVFLPPSLLPPLLAVLCSFVPPLPSPSLPQRFQWYDKGPEVADLYIDYLTHLLSAQTFFLQSSLYALVQTLYSQHPPSSPSGRGSPPPSPPSPSGQGTAEDKEQESVYLNVHEALWAVIHTVPTAPSVLMPILSKKYPFKGKNAELQVSPV